MRLYLVQHAEAKSEEEDPSRPLSEKGLADIRMVADFLEAKGIKVSAILHSGKLRARQTAEALAECISPSRGIEQVKALAPLDNPKIWAEKLKEESRRDLMLVGHLPYLSRLTGLLLTGNSEQEIVGFRPGGVVCLERDEAGNLSVRWTLIPELLAKAK